MVEVTSLDVVVLSSLLTGTFTSPDSVLGAAIVMAVLGVFDAVAGFADAGSVDPSGRVHGLSLDILYVCACVTLGHLRKRCLVLPHP